ncbi:MAG: carbamoyltransferase [Isosphaerales bacterium]
MALARGRLILGVNCAYHESAAALVRDGEVCFAIEEERLTRVKHAKTACVSNPDELPWNAIRACLAAAPEAALSDLGAIAYSLVPGRRLARIGGDSDEIEDDMGFGSPRGEEEFNRRVLGIPHILARAARDDSLAGRFHFVPHHRAHAASAFHASPFRSAAVLVVDGIGETSTAWLGRGSPEGLEAIEEIEYPHSIGMLWERVAVYLGFTEFDACKVMGLAAFGDPRRFRSEIDRLFRLVDRDGGMCRHDGPPFLLDPALARLRSKDVCGLESLFGPRRSPLDPPELERFADVAAGLQRRTEEAILALGRRLARATGERDLAFAGGVALNCISNARLEREGPFRSLFMLGAAHDAGTAVGAALEIARETDGALEKSRRLPPRVLTPFLGPLYDDSTIDAAISRWGFPTEKVQDPARMAATLLADGRFVGWFQGRMEFGPRALGGRSLLADPRRTGVRDALNRRIKHRESFRPFGASVLADDAADWFKLPGDRPGAVSCRDLMILAYPVRPERAPLIPAVLHQDGTCRIQLVDGEQTPLFHALISRFRELTGVPLVLNTSFNDQEPLVATPDDALRTFAGTHIDALFLGDRLVRRAR